MGWMFKDVEALKAVPKLSADLIKDPYYRFLNKYFLFLQIPIGLSLYAIGHKLGVCLLYTSPSPRDLSTSRMPSSA